MTLSEQDVDDDGLVSEAELASTGTASYRSSPIMGVVSGVVTVNVTYPIERYDDPVQAGDVFVLTGASAGDGTYTVAAITGDFTFTVVEPIVDSTGGAGDFRHPPGAGRVGVDTTGFANTVAVDAQNVLADLDAAIASGGITEPQHQLLDTLVHDLSEDAYTEPSFTGPAGRVDGSVTWTDVTKTTKIRECLFSYTGPLVTQVVTIQYDGAGVEVERLTQTIAYVPGTTRVQSITDVRLP